MVNPGTPAGQGKIIDKDDYLHLIMIKKSIYSTFYHEHTSKQRRFYIQLKLIG